VQPSENPKNPKNTPVDPLTSVGSTGDKENSSRAQNCFFSPQPLENLMIGGSNQVQRSSNFGEMKMMTSRTHPQKISTKFLTDKEESKEIGARAGFCEKLKNVKNKRARESRGFCTRQESMDSLQGAQRITTNLCSCPQKESTNHSMVWEESRKFRARTGFSLELKNFESKMLVNPRHLA